jgi:hypothetical protein
MKGRITNPLDPVYILPSSYPPIVQTASTIPHIPTNHVDDICDRSRSLQSSVERRNPLDISDIPFTQSDYYRRFVRPVSSAGRVSSLDVIDINRGWQRRARPRGTNPNEPVYCISSSEPVGPVAGSRPFKRTAHITPREEVPGARPQRYVGCVPHSSLQPPVASKVADSGTTDPVREKRRIVNPMNPLYPLLDGSRDPIESLIHSECL